MTQNNDIERLIERYFDCTASPEEEALLKALLADPATEATPAVEEARAVTGYTAVQKAISEDVGQPRPNVLTPQKWIASAAAAAAVALAVTIGWHAGRGDSLPDTAIVYAQGRVIHSTDDALDIMASQLGAMGKASADSPAADILKSLQQSLTTTTTR